MKNRFSIEVRRYLFLLLSLFTLQFSYASETIGNLTYDLNSKTFEASVAGCDNSVSEIIIPEKISFNDQEYTVTTIKNSAFSGYSKLTHIEIPNSVARIDYNAFKDCINLNNIKIPNSVTYIGDAAFWGCKSFTNILIPNSVTLIGNSAFWGCYDLIEVIFEDGNEILQIGYTSCHIFSESPLETVYLGRNLSYDSKVNSWSPIANKNTLKTVIIGENVTELPVHLLYNCESLRNISIPNTVKYIGAGAFAWCSNLTNIIIPDSVNTLEDDLFADCTNLARVELPNSLISIGNSTFRDCTSLATFEIPNSVVTIGSSAFLGCTNLTSLEIPKSVTSIGNSAFAECNALKDLIIENGTETLKLGYISDSKSLFGDSPLESVHLGRPLSYQSILNRNTYGYSPFACQKNLQRVTISENIKTLPGYFFYNCETLSSIEIPSSVTTIENYAFKGCISLNDLSFADGNEPLQLGNDYTREAMFKDSKLGTIYLGRTLFYKDRYSPFASQKILTSVKIGNNVEELPNYLLYYCEALKNIEIPNSVNIIGNSVFSGCTSLKELKFADGNEPLQLGYNSTSAGLFADCPLEKVYLGRTLSYSTYSNGTSYGYSPFANQKNLISMEIGNTVQALPQYLLFNCEALKNIEIPNSVMEIGDYAFYHSEFFIDQIFYNPGDEFAHLGTNSFNYTSNLFVTSKDKTIEIINNSEWNNFSKIYYNEGGNTFIPVSWNEGIECLNAFYCNEIGCLVRSGENVTIKAQKSVSFAVLNGINILYDLLTSEGYTFQPSLYWSNNKIYSENNDMSKTVNVTSPGNLFNQLGLEDIQKTQTIKINGDLNGTDILTINRMTSLVNLDLSDANIVEGGVTYRENYSTANQSIGSYFFSDCINLQNLILPNSILTISEHAFDSMTSLKNVVLGNLIVSIGDGSFYDCKSIDGLLIPFSVNSIGNSAFYGCSSLNYLTIPNSITFIGNNSFDGCSSLNALNFEDGNEILQLGYNSKTKGLFEDCPIENIYLGRPISYLSDYNISPFTNQFNLQSLIIGESVTVLPDNLLYNCKTLPSIQLPNSITSIGRKVFYGCSGLINIVIPNSVNSLGESAFSGCTSISSIEISNQLKIIESNTFYGCSSLTNIKIPNSIISIKGEAFKGCLSLQNIIFEDGDDILELGRNLGGSVSGLFIDCPLKSLYIGRNLDYEGAYHLEDSRGNPFTSQYNLDSVELSKNVKSIPNYLFFNCRSIPNIEIPNTVTYIGDCAFHGCGSLKDLIIPNSVTYIGYQAFEGCRSLSRIEIPNSISLIERWVFENCSGLQEVGIPNSVIEIKEGAFSQCKSLITITIPNSVTSIGQSTFEDCSSLESLILGSDLTSIGIDAFNGCDALKKIISLNPIPPKIFSSTFSSETKENCKLVVTKGNLVYYWLDPIWKDFLNMSDDLLYLYPLPTVKYGNEPINLAEFAPEGYDFTYESSNTQVAKLEGDYLSIIGAGEVTIGASYNQDGSAMEVMGQMRQFIVDKAELTIGVEDLIIAQGQPYPDFTLYATGLVYDDTLEEIGQLPTVYCDYTQASPPGEYPIYLRGGFSNNYDLTLQNGTLTVVENTSVYPESITLNYQNLTLNIGENVQLEATVLPEDATDKTVIWESSNEKVASVTSDGMVTAIAEGTATITAHCGDITAYCQVTVLTPFIEASQLILNMTTAEVNVGETVQLVATVLPEDATDKTVTWESSNEKVASVTLDGMVTAIAEGTATITAHCGDIYADCIITVAYSGIDSLLADPDAQISIYSIDGIIIRKDCKIEDMKSLNKGIYIIVAGKERYKISI